MRWRSPLRVGMRIPCVRGAHPFYPVVRIPKTADMRVPVVENRARESVHAIPEGKVLLQKEADTPKRRPMFGEGKKVGQALWNVPGTVLVARLRGSLEETTRTFADRFL